MPIKGWHHSEESKTKMSITRTGKPHPHRGHKMSLENKTKLLAVHTGSHHKPDAISKMSRTKKSKGLRGKNSPLYGRHLTDECKAKISIARMGQTPSDETRAKLSAIRKGKPRSEDTKQKISNALKGRTLSPEHCAKMSSANIGKQQSLETRLKKSNASSGKNNPMYGKTREFSPAWRGGISFEPYCPKFNENLKLRVREFFENRCLMCGMTENENGKRLSVHHVTYDKMTCCNETPVIFAALCHRHHCQTNRWDRQRWENMLRRSIEEIWGGKSYFTNEEYAEIVQ